MQHPLPTLWLLETMAPGSCATFSSIANDVWYKFTAVQDGNATVAMSNVGASLDAVLEVFSGTCGTLTEIACSDDNGVELVKQPT